MSADIREQLYFDEIKEPRGSFFVEYHPPVSNNPFATLNLVYPGDYQLDQVSNDMRAEMAHWLGRYPVPIMIWAFDVVENIIRPNGSSDDGLLVGWFVPGTEQIASSWKLDDLPPFLNDTTALTDWRTIYKDVPFRTDTEVKASARAKLAERRKQNLVLKIALSLWIAVIPGIWAVTEYFGPEWLGFIVLLYTLWQLVRTWQKLMGHTKPSAREHEESEKQRKKDHYYYHCERNPDGFARLKVENFERDFSESTRREAEELAKPRSEETNNPAEIQPNGTKQNPN